MLLLGGPLRKVVKVEALYSKYARPGQGSNLVTLECGHQVARRMSVPVPQRMHCRYCKWKREQEEGEVGEVKAK